MRRYLGDIEASLTENVLEDVFASFRAVLPFDRLSFVRIVDESLVCEWVRSAGEASTVLVPGYSLPLAQTTLGSLIASRRPRVINDLAQYLQDRPTSKSTRLVIADGVRSSLTVPIVDQQRVVGFLIFSSFTRAAYAGLDTAALLSLGRIVSGILCLEREQRELLRERDDARYASEHDSSTGLLNCRGIDAEAGRFDDDRRNAQVWRLVAFIDVDGMKEINDRFGHAVGDDVLRCVAMALREHTRQGDLIGRVGGDEFVVIAPFPAEDVAAAEAFADGLVHWIRMFSGHPEFTISIGTEWLPPGGDRLAAVAAADHAMYRSKTAKRSDG